MINSFFSPQNTAATSSLASPLTTSTATKDKYVLYFDGCSKANPGPAGCGAILYKNDCEFAFVSEYLGHQTNNYAEYMALIKGLELAISHGADGDSLLVRGDSMLVINQMKGIWKVKNAHLQTLHLQAKQLQFKIPRGVTFEHIYRNLNARADELANAALLSVR